MKGHLARNVSGAVTHPKRRPIALLFCLLLAASGIASAQQAMTVRLFNQLVAAPGDSTPLNQKLAPIPIWPTAVCSNHMQYQDGRVFTEECPVTAKTIQGRYVVSTVYSKYYNQPMHAILTYDEGSQAYKQWALFGTNLIEATLVIDFAKNVTASTSRYDPGFLELSVSTFSTSESSEHSLAYKDGALFLTRDSVTRPIRQPSARNGVANP